MGRKALGDTTMSLEVQVHEFAKFMDRACPNWELGMDADRLDIASDKKCLFGQLYGSFKRGCKELGLSLEQAIAFGLHAPATPGTDQRQYYAVSNRAWVREIECRMPAFV